jgi:hypothetical protein
MACQVSTDGKLLLFSKTFYGYDFYNAVPVQGPIVVKSPRNGSSPTLTVFRSTVATALI